jgi:hypothetical protein
MAGFADSLAFGEGARAAFGDGRAANPSTRIAASPLSWRRRLPRRRIPYEKSPIADPSSVPEAPHPSMTDL